MFSFTRFLIESENKIAYHLDKNPEHKDFLDSFLSSNRHNRSKYLDWVTKSLNQSPLTNAEQLGKAVDFYHQSKHKQGVIPTELKDINKFKSHDDFINRISDIQNDQPISDKETKYDHPDNNVTYNNKGLKITNIGSHDAAKQIRTCYGGSLCTTMNDSGHYDGYNPGSLHLYEFRNPDSGKVERYFSGLKNDRHEFANLDNDHIPLNKLHSKLQELIYHNGPDRFKGRYEIAPSEEKKKIDNQIELAKNLENHERLLNTYGKDIHPLAQEQMLKNNKNILPKLIDTLGDKLHPQAQILTMFNNNPSVAHKLIETMGDKLDINAQNLAIRHRDPSVAHKVIDTLGDKLHPEAQKEAMYNEDPSVAHKLIDTLGDKLHPQAQKEAVNHEASIAHKVIDNMGLKLHPNAQEHAMYHKDPSVAHKVIDNMGLKLHPNAQDHAMYNNNSSVAHKVIETMGDKLDINAQNLAIRHRDPSVREKATNLYGEK